MKHDLRPYRGHYGVPRPIDIGVIRAVRDQSTDSERRSAVTSQLGSRTEEGWLCEAHAMRTPNIATTAHLLELATCVVRIIRYAMTTMITSVATLTAPSPI